MIEKAYKVHNQDGSVIANKDIIWTTTAGTISPQGILTIDRDTFAKGGTVTATIPSYGKSIEQPFGLLPENYAEGLTICDAQGEPIVNGTNIARGGGRVFKAFMAKTSDGRILHPNEVEFWASDGIMSPGGLWCAEPDDTFYSFTIGCRSLENPNVIASNRLTYGENTGFKLYYGNAIEVPVSGLDLPRNHQNKPTDILFYAKYNGVTVPISELIWSTSIGKIENNVLHLEASEPQTSGTVYVRMNGNPVGIEFAVGYTVQGLNDPWGFGGAPGIYEKENADAHGLSFGLEIPGRASVYEDNLEINPVITTPFPDLTSTARWSASDNYFRIHLENAVYIGCKKEDFNLYCNGAEVLDDFVIHTHNDNRFCSLNVRLTTNTNGRTVHSVNYNWDWDEAEIGSAQYLGGYLVLSMKNNKTFVLGDDVKLDYPYGILSGENNVVFAIRLIAKSVAFALLISEKGRTFAFFTIDTVNNRVTNRGGEVINITGTPPSYADINSAGTVNPWQPGGGDDVIIGGNGNGDGKPDIDNTEKPPTGGDSGTGNTGGDSNSGGNGGVGDGGTVKPDDEITDIVADTAYIPTGNEVIGRGRLICLRDRPDCVIGVRDYDPFNGKDYRRVIPNILAICIPENRGENYDIIIDLKQIENYDPLETKSLQFNMNGNCYDINSDSYAGVQVGNVNKNEDGTYKLTIAPAYKHELGSVQINALIDGYAQRTIYGIPIYFYSENASTEDIADKFTYAAQNACDYVENKLGEYIDRISVK